MRSPLDSRSIGWVAGSTRKSTASFRLRSLRPVQLLSAAGVNAKIVAGDVIDGYDVVVFQKAFDARHIELAHRLQRAGSRVVFDVCDNHLYNPTGDAAKVARASLMREMLDLADTITVSTDTLRGMLGIDGVVVPDALERPPSWMPHVARLRRARRGANALRLVWMGTAGEPETGWGMTSLLDLAGPLSELGGRWDLRLTAITNDRRIYEDLAPQLPCPTKFTRWRLASAGIVYANADVALIPVARNDFTWGKTSNRLATSIQLGVPAVVSPTPSYLEFTGATLFEDWVANVERYRRDPELVTDHLREGRSIAARLHGDDVVRESWEHVLTSVLS
jgi:hypothetical protein